MTKDALKELLNDPQAPADFFEHAERLIQLIASMRSGHDGADARLAFGHSRERNASCHYTFLEELARELHRQSSFADDDGGDRSLAGRGVLAADVETECPEFLLEVAGVLPQLFDQLGLVFQHFEGSDAG